MSLLLEAPQPLSAQHLTESFQSGESSLDDWLKRKALTNQSSGASRTFVVVDQQKRVMGYYALAAGAVTHQLATGNIKRNMPDPIPVMVLGRLAVDLGAQGMKLGSALLQDAVNRSLVVSQNTGVRALLVHALSEKAKQFYEYYGFTESPINPMTLMLRLKS
jgi:predicted GNAT family N-acyltransferase